MTITLDERPDLGAPVATTAVSLAVTASRRGGLLSIEEWSEVGRQLGRLGNSALWWIGDWMALGERTYGSTYAEAQAITGLAYQTLANLASVCNAVEVSRRRETLSFAHHAEVAALAPWAQAQWLAGAVRDGMTAKELRDRIRSDRQLPAPATVATLRFVVAPERAHIWQEAAADSGLEFDDWAAKVLDAASMVPQPDWAASIEA